MQQWIWKKSSGVAQLNNKHFKSIPHMTQWLSLMINELVIIFSNEWIGKNLYIGAQSGLIHSTSQAQCWPLFVGFWIGALEAVHLCWADWSRLTPSAGPRGRVLAQRCVVICLPASYKHCCRKPNLYKFSLLLAANNKGLKNITRLTDDETDSRSGLWICKD